MISCIWVKLVALCGFTMGVFLPFQLRGKLKGGTIWKGMKWWRCLFSSRDMMDLLKSLLPKTNNNWSAFRKSLHQPGLVSCWFFAPMLGIFHWNLTFRNYICKTQTEYPSQMTFCGWVKNKSCRACEKWVQSRHIFLPYRFQWETWLKAISSLQPGLSKVQHQPQS